MCGLGQMFRRSSAAVATSREGHRSLRSDLDSGNTITVPKSKSVLTVEGQHAS
jgi:hypothetical protein